jgi:6-phosphogluconate dehydrogenase
MQVGMIGLGRMGGSMAKRWRRAGHQVSGYARHWETVQGALDAEAIDQGAHSIEELVSGLARPRLVWLMVPAAAVDATLEQVAPFLDDDDVVVDGGNSYYRDDLRRAAELKVSGVHYLDVGTSGGVWGLERGYCLMIGGDDEAVRRLDPLFKALAPGAGSIDRTPGRDKRPGTAEEGYLYCGPSGAGHFVKMVHNGIEYGLMAAYAEGLNILKHADVGKASGAVSAEETPLREPGAYQYDLDLADVTEVWRRGSVVASWLLDLTAAALVDDAELREFSGRVSDSGEGRWTVLAAVEEGTPAPVLSSALYSRFSSRGQSDYADKLLSAMRFQFGGHHELEHT